ncbi:hypothetical protein BDZ89DRAFT_746874 [Hymenopellis radicata]|nr:hypothetical protein BDZ89DRAFT_746874 [Hymenopellis radicata]
MGFIRAASTSSSTTASVVCSNCGKKGHTADRCWAEGGGAQGKAPNWWYKAKRKTKKTPDAVSAAATSTSSTLPSATTDANTVTRAAETYILATAVDEKDVLGSGSPQADLTLLSADTEKALNDILLDKRRSVLFVGEQANHRTLPLALGVARGSLDGVFATYYEKGGEAARLKDIISAMKQSRDSHADYLTMHHDLEEFLTYLSGLGDTWQTLSDHIYAWRADARCLSRFFDEHPDCPKDAVIWFQSPWRKRRRSCR